MAGFPGMEPDLLRYDDHRGFGHKKTNFFAWTVGILLLSGARDCCLARELLHPRATGTAGELSDSAEATQGRAAKAICFDRGSAR